MVGARKKGEGLEKREKGRDFVFIKVCVGGRWQEEDRNKNSHYFLSSLLPSLPELDSDAKERCQGAGFSVLFLSCFLRAWLPSLAPHLVGLRLQKERDRGRRQCCGNGSRGRGRPPS